MPLIARVEPGATVAPNTAITPALLNALGTPVVYITGTLDGTVGLAALSVAEAHLQSGAVSARVVDATASFTMAGLTVNGAITATGAVTVGGLLTANGNMVLGNATTDTLAFNCALDAATPQKTAPVDGDKLLLADSAASDVLKWALRSDLLKGALNLQSAVVAGTVTLTSLSWATITGLSLSITPRSTSSKILLFAMVNGGIPVNGGQTFLRFARNDGASDTVIGSGTGAGSRQAIHAAITDSIAGANGVYSTPMLYVDSPSTTSARTYKVQAYGNQAGGGGNIYFGRSGNDTDSTANSRSPCVLIALEIP